MQQYKFKNNKYTVWYQQLLKTAKAKHRTKTTACYEKHHIIPKSLGGDNSKVNLVLLTPREHFVAHLLLVRMVQREDVYKMVNAIRRFKTKVSTATEFGLLRATISTFSKGVLNPAFNKIWIHNLSTNEIQYVDKITFNQMPQDQYKKGLPYQRGGHNGTIWVSNGVDESCIKPERLAEFMLHGWTTGRLNPASNDHMKLMANNRHTLEKDTAHSVTLSGRIVVKHVSDGSIKRIKPIDLEMYQALGYVANADLGRPLSYVIKIEGTVYTSLLSAANAHNIAKITLDYRLNSNLAKWKNWEKLYP